jgi:hypothetical protein
MTAETRESASWPDSPPSRPDTLSQTVQSQTVQPACRRSGPYVFECRDRDRILHMIARTRRQLAIDPFSARLSVCCWWRHHRSRTAHCTGSMSRQRTAPPTARDRATLERARLRLVQYWRLARRLAIQRAAAAASRLGDQRGRGWSRLDAPMIGFDQSRILNDPIASGAVLTTLFHYTAKLVDGRYFVLDEVWAALLRRHWYTLKPAVGACASRLHGPETSQTRFRPQARTADDTKRRRTARLDQVGEHDRGADRGPASIASKDHSNTFL